MAKTHSYTEAYNRLQEILRMMEEDRLDVDEVSEKIKEATELLNVCKKKLFVMEEEVKKALENLE